MDNPAIKVLELHLKQLKDVKAFDSLEAEAKHIGEINQIENAIKQIKLCEEFGINGGSLINKLPETGSIHQCFKVAYDNESSKPENWEEVKFDGKSIIFASGDCIVRV
ncbi:hypothetical protein QTP81_13660 [Alteromonas sp. ASW11-36]|uniref:Uncharacterized protein n=1 Tax=Alteromonas arenosi TaxID=3055817 RepID=A0ABT7SZN4_9ALTE|nr:hypothetical protein [Alteromonas sp. ASW11-36]MDM7861642.1 hypothetical protein [Alteromonas sp. ASW11-36]